MRELARRLNELWDQRNFRSLEKGARIGCYLLRPDTGDTYGVAEHQWFVPASNNKLWTTAAALDRLGPGYRWFTGFGVDQRGALWIRGGGDPVFGWEDARKVAQRISEEGVRFLRGPLYLDDHLFEARPWGSGWMWDDLAEGFASPVHALNMERNRVTFTADPTENRPLLRWFPELPDIRATAKLTWTEEPESDVRVTRKKRSNVFHLQGELSRYDPRVEGAVWSGPRFFADMMWKACREAGIQVKEHPQIRMISHSPDAPVRIRYASPPLSRVLHWVNGESDNLVAEVILKTVALEVSGIGSEEKGVEIVPELLRRKGIEPPGKYMDGSGLSMLNLSSPFQIVRLLEFMIRHPQWNEWVESLAVYGSSGTLARRQGVLPPGITVSAKTGTLTGVKSLSGVVLRENRPVYVFALLINGLLDEKNGEQLQDQFLQLLAEEAASG